MLWKMDAFVRRCPCLRPKADDVRILDYRHCSLSDVPIEIFNFERTLEELYLDSNQIHDLPRPLFHCHELHILGLSDNEIHSLPPAVASLINLEELDIGKNAILDIPDNIKGCKSLRILDASVNPLGKLPEGFTQLINIEELYLNDTFVDFLPASFGRLSRLRVLELRENHLKSLPKSIARLMNLTRLDIGQNHFRELPEVIGSLPKLSELWCDCNRISALPKVLGNLQQLTYLDASQNRIEDVPEEMENCSSLTDVTLSGNNLAKLPDTFGKLKNLTVLRLDDNKLRRLPNSIGNLSNLEEFILSQNDLTSLPLSIGLLRKMHTFIIDDNMIEELPSELGSCASMTILSARNNRLRRIPDELGHIPHLRILNLSSNQIRYLPFSVTKLRDLQALWLSENQNKPLIPLQGDIDIDTGQRVLTCYALPQVPEEHFDERFNDTDSFHSTSWEEQRQRRQHIKFAFDEKMDKPGKLVRNPTPYPKELKSHVKHARNQALKSKCANYVNVASLDTGSSKLNESVDELSVPIVQEAKILHSFSTVMIKEARVTKPKSPGTSPKLHDRRLLYKYDKDKNAKDKARLQRQNSVDAQLIVSSTTSSPSCSKKDEQDGTGVSGVVTLTKPHSHPTTVGKYSSLPELTNPELLSSEREGKSKYNPSRFMKKFENLKQGKSNYRGLPSVENGYRSDHELYANVVNQRLREVGGGRSMKMTGAHDGYGSDRETFMAQQTRNTLTTSTRSPSIDQRGRSASVSTTIVRKSNNSSSSPANSPFIASRCRFLDEETNCHNFNESANSNFPVLVNNNQDLPQIGPQYSEDLSEVTKTNDVGLNCSDSQQRFQPNSLVVGDTVNSLSYQTSNSPMSCSHPSPTLSLPSKNRLTYSVPVTRHSPPALPPRVRPGQKHPSLSSISNMPISPKSHSVTPAPPSPHRSQKPPPYHIAAVYSKHIGESSLGSISGNTCHFSVASLSPFPHSPKLDLMPTNTGHIDYLPVSKRCGSKSQPVGETQFNLPSPSLKKTASNFQQWPHRTSTQNQRPHDSNISLRHSHASHQPLNSNSTISHFQQQSYGSVNGAVVYGNPYTTEQEMLNHSSSPSSCTSSALYSNASPNHRPSSYSKQPSPYDDFSPPVNTPAKKVGSLCGSRGSMSPLLRSKPSLKSTPLSPSLIPRSSSAPSTPPLGEHSPTNLPPYRTPPLYQSVSVGNLNRTNRDVAALNPRVGYSLSKKRRDGKLQVQPMEREYVKVPVSSPICEFGPESHHAFAHLGPTRVSCNLSAGFESMATRDEGKSRTSSQNTSGVLKMNSSPSPQRTVTTPLRCASSDQNGIFTARPAIADGSDKHDPNENGSREFGAGYNGLSHATQCNTDLCGTVLTNPYAKPRHPPNLTQDKPSLDGVNVPLVVPTPHRPMTSTNHVFNSGGSKGEHDDKLYDAVKSVVSDDQIVSQHSTKKPFWMFGQHHNPQVIPVVIQKNPDLGFTITYKYCSLSNHTESAIYVDSVKSGGAASSVLKPGDRVLQVDGRDFTNLDLSSANRLLDSTGPTVFMMVSRNC